MNNVTTLQVRVKDADGYCRNWDDVLATLTFADEKDAETCGRILADAGYLVMRNYAPGCWITVFSTAEINEFPFECACGERYTKVEYARTCRKCRTYLGRNHHEVIDLRTGEEAA